MTTSQALSTGGAQPSTSFTESGQLDWVALSRLSFSCTWELAARLCNAGVATVTVIAGRGICSSFAFPPEGQDELTNSLSRFKGSSSYSKVLWFGLGIKHIVNEMCTTEPGATCVALCAAMSIPYTSFHAAQVWRELSALRGAPQGLIPARSQWSALVDVCAGCLTHSKFSIYFAQFCRFLAPDECEPRAPASPKDIAKALATLADLSSGKLVSSIFIGGVDCAWLAVFAEYLLRLRVEIQDENGKFLYGSNRLGLPLPSQAIFRKQSSPSSSSDRALIQRVCFVSKGELLLQELTHLTASPIRRSTKWSTILSDTFSMSTWEQFTAPPVREAFSELVQCIALHSKLYFSNPGLVDEDDLCVWWLQWPGYGCLYHPRLSGPELLKNVRERFSELNFLSETLAYGPDECVHRLSSTMESRLRDISTICKCFTCAKTSAGQPPVIRRICLVRMSMTIIRLLLILAPVDVHCHIPPSTTALLQLYNCTIKRSSLGQATGLPCHGVPLVLFLFTGHLPTYHVPLSVSAASAGGVCVFLSLLKDISLSPLEATIIEVIPGHISSEGHLFTFLIDIDISTASQEYLTAIPQTSDILHLTPSSFELVVEEQEEAGILGATYKSIHGSNQTTCISPAGIQKSIRSFLRTTITFDRDCGDANKIERPVSWSFHPVRSAAGSDRSETSLDNFNAPWLILAWDCYTCQSGDGTQSLEIEVFEGDCAALLVVASQLYSKWAFNSDWNQRGHVIIAQLGCFPDALAQLAMDAWSTIHWEISKDRRTQQERRPVQTCMNKHKKKGSIKIFAKDSGAEGREILFELLPIKHNQEVVKAPVQLFTRLARVSKSAGRNK